MKRAVLIVLTALAVLSAADAGVRGATADGGIAASFLQVPIGARPAGMGGAYRAVSNDGAGILYNPAGVCMLNRPLFGVSYRVMRLDRVMGYATFLTPAKNQAVLGANWLYAGSGSVAMRTSDGHLTGENFQLNSSVFGGIFAKRFEDLLAVGMKINYFHMTIPSVTAYSVGIDLGTMLYVSSLVDRESRDKLPVQEIQIGLTVKNLAAKMRWNSEQFLQSRSGNKIGSVQEDTLHVEYGLGGSARFLRQRLLVAIDAVKNSVQGIRFHAGGEYYLSDDFALRIGHSDGRFTAGTGYLFKVGTMQYAIDYAFSADRVDEGSEHIFSLDVLF